MAATARTPSRGVHVAEAAGGDSKDPMDENIMFVIESEESISFEERIAQFVKAVSAPTPTTHAAVAPAALSRSELAASLSHILGEEKCGRIFKLAESILAAHNTPTFAPITQQGEPVRKYTSDQLKQILINMRMILFELGQLFRHVPLAQYTNGPRDILRLLSEQGGALQREATLLSMLAHRRRFIDQRALSLRGKLELMLVRLLEHGLGRACDRANIQAEMRALL
eukprot:m.37809 g.37809  ORF g.37809 m.37809 type:complete len:226 (+) comp9873_c0_seq1:21-698(+)